MVKAVTTEVGGASNREPVTQAAQRNAAGKASARKMLVFKNLRFYFGRNTPIPKVKSPAVSILNVGRSPHAARHSQRPNRGKSLMAFPLIT
jgi:hypothetical protein